MCTVIRAIVTLAMLSCVFRGVAALAQTNTEKIKVGVTLPLSGNSALWGTDIKNGLLFANEDLAQGRYELIIEDDRCDAKTAVTIAHKFIEIEKVKWVLGFGCSGTLLSTAKLYEQAHVVVI